MSQDKLFLPYVISIRYFDHCVSRITHTLYMLINLKYSNKMHRATNFKKISLANSWFWRSNLDQVCWLCSSLAESWIEEIWLYPGPECTENQDLQFSKTFTPTGWPKALGSPDSLAFKCLPKAPYWDKVFCVYVGGRVGVVVLIFKPYHSI